MNISPSISWILEFVLFLLRQVYIVDQLQGSSGRFISLFTTNHAAAKPTPLIFFFHRHLCNLLIKMMWLIRLIKVHVLFHIGKTNPELLTDDQKVSQRFLHIINSTGLSEEKVISFLYETAKVLNPDSESSLRTMWIKGTLPDSYQSKMESFFGIFYKYLPAIIKNETDLFRNPAFMQLQNKSGKDDDFVIDVISKKRIAPVYYCTHCGYLSLSSIDLCVCGGVWGYVRRGDADVRTNDVIGRRR